MNFLSISLGTKAISLITYDSYTESMANIDGPQ